MPTIDHPTPFRPGDRVRSRLGSLATFVADDQPPGYVSVQFDFDDMPSVYEVAELEPAAPVDADQARADLLEDAAAASVLAHQNLLDAIEQEGVTLPQVAEHAGVGLHKLTAAFSRRAELTVSEFILVAFALGRLPGDLLPGPEVEYEIPADEQQEITAEPVTVDAAEVRRYVADLPAERPEVAG